MSSQILRCGFVQSHTWRLRLFRFSLQFLPCKTERNMAVSSDITRTTSGSYLVFFPLFVTQQSEQNVYKPGGRYLNTPAITRMGSTTIMRDSQRFEQCPHLGPALAQTAIKRAPNITVIVYRPLSTSAAVILPVSSIICSDIRTAFILNSFHTCIAEWYLMRN